LTKVYNRRRFPIPSSKVKDYTYGGMKTKEPDGGGDNFNHVINHDYMKHFAKTMQERTDKMQKSRQEGLKAAHNFKKVKETKAMRLRHEGIKDHYLSRAPSMSEIRFNKVFGDKKSLKKSGSLLSLRSRKP
jgi:hypothetical protein